LKVIKGFFIHNDSIVRNSATFTTAPSNKNIYVTENQAKSAIAMAKLSQLMSVYNGDWVADWNNPNQIKWCIFFKRGLTINPFGLSKQFLAFKDMETAKEFFTNFKEDIEIYFNY